jgi:hypothetical protein
MDLLSGKPIIVRHNVCISVGPATMIPYTRPAQRSAKGATYPRLHAQVRRRDAIVGICPSSIDPSSLNALNYRLFRSDHAVSAFLLRQIG